MHAKINVTLMRTNFTKLERARILSREKEKCAARDDGRRIFFCVASSDAHSIRCKVFDEFANECDAFKIIGDANVFIGGVSA